MDVGAGRHGTVSHSAYRRGDSTRYLPNSGREDSSAPPSSPGAPAVPAPSPRDAREEPGASTPDPSETARSRGRSALFRSVWVPLEGATPLHSIALTSVLVLDALLVLLVPPGTTGVTGTGPALYLLVPAAAGLYMSLVALGTRSTSRFGEHRSAVTVLALLALVGSLGGITLVSLSGGPFPGLGRITGSNVAFPLCLAGTSLAIASLWASGALMSQPPMVRVFALLVPPWAAALVGLVPLTSGGQVVLTTLVLGVSASMFQVAQPLRDRTSDASAIPLGHPEPETIAAPPVEPPPPVARRPAPAPTAPRPVAQAMAPVGAASVPRAEPPPSIAPVRRAGGWPNVVSTGFRWLDVLLLGGLPRRGQIAVVSGPHAEGDAVISGTLAEALRRGESVVIVAPSTLRPLLAERLGRARPGFAYSVHTGRVLWVDLPLASSRGGTSGAGGTGSPGYVSMLGALVAAASDAERRSPLGFALAVFGLDPLFDVGGETGSSAVVRNMVGILRERTAIVLYSIERETVPEETIRRSTSFLDGALLFRSTRQGSAVKVLRVGPAESRDWVPGTLDPRAEPMPARA